MVSNLGVQINNVNTVNHAIDSVNVIRLTMVTDISTLSMRFQWLLTIKAPTTTAADDNFHFIYL